MWSVECTVCSMQCVVFSVQCLACSLQCAVCREQFFCVQFKMCIVHRAVCSVQFVVFSVQCGVNTLQCAVWIGLWKTEGQCVKIGSKVLQPLVPPWFCPQKYLGTVG